MLEPTDWERVPFVLSLNAQRYPKRVAVRTKEQAYTYQQIDDWSDSVAQVLLSRGVRPKDRVLVIASTSVEQVVLFAAMLRIGAVFSPVSPRLPSVQMDDMANQVGASLCLFQEGIASLPKKLPCVSLNDLFCEASSCTRSDNSLPLLSMRQEATLIWTSGSSRKPKAALHWYRNHYYSALGSNQNIPLKENDSWLLSLPMYHVAGIAIVMRSWVAGTSIDVPSQTSSFVANLKHFRSTHVSLVATQFMRCLKEEGSLFQGTRAILLGGSAISHHLLQEAAQRHLPIYVSYGATEMASQITTTRASTQWKDWHSAGHLLPYRELRLTEGGEVTVRGLTRFAGYLTSTGLDTPFDEEGWFAMNDIGIWEKDGSLRILGRKDAMFISGGENIQPEEIEWALEQHQDVVQAVVVAVPDDEFGARPHAFLRTKDGVNPADGELRGHLRSYIAGFKIPDKYHLWPEDLRTTGIKVSRSELLRTIQKVS